MPTERDYDSDPERFRLGSRVTAERLRPGISLYAKVAAALAERGVERVLDLGCGEGALRAATDALVPPPWVVGMDASATMLAAVPAPVVRADATAIPFADNVFDAVVAINVLDHLTDPLPAIRDGYRVLRPGGVLVAGAISRHDAPELASVWRPTPTPFDAEEAPALVGSVFDEVQVDSWDAPLVTLPETAAIIDFLVARFVPVDQATSGARTLATPLVVTKRGALVIGRKG